MTALERLARQSMPREYLTGWKYSALAKYMDLFPHGYSVNLWFRPRDKRTCLEYNPRLSDKPRLTAFTYTDQRAIHEALGLHVVPPGATWDGTGQRGLFDEIEGVQPGRRRLRQEKGKRPLLPRAVQADDCEPLKAKEQDEC